MSSAAGNGLAAVLSGEIASRRRSEALDATATPRWVRRFARLLVVVLAIGPFVLMLAPWQQTVRGSGRVIAFDPLDRQQQIDAPISGRVSKWWVQEGSRVKEGEPMFEIVDIDPLRVERLAAQLDAMHLKLEAYTSQAEQYEQNVENIRGVGDLTVEASRAKLQQVKDRVTAAEAAVTGARAELLAAEQQVARKRRLIDGGAVSLRELEVAEASFGVASAKVGESIARLDAAKQDVVTAERELERAMVDAASRVNSAVATLEETRSKVADTRQKITEMEGDISRQAAQLVTAPRDGVVQRLQGYQGGEIVSAGQPLVVLVPDTQSRAVEIWVDGNDAPLVSAGAEVRLQFEGWPAVQFTGWPSAAVGTFPGTVALVDPSDDGQGRFRCVVVPLDEQDWPSTRYLRQGVRANGWVLLNEVKIGFEIWRQLNGFPPVIANEEPEGVARKRLK